MLSYPQLLIVIIIGSRLLDLFLDGCAQLLRGLCRNLHILTYCTSGHDFGKVFAQVTNMQTLKVFTAVIQYSIQLKDEYIFGFKCKTLLTCLQAINPASDENLYFTEKIMLQHFKNFTVLHSSGKVHTVYTIFVCHKEKSFKNCVLLINPTPILTKK